MSLPAYAFSRQGAYKLPGQVFQGAGIAEFLCCIMLMSRKYSSDPKVVKTAIFQVAMLAMLFAILTLISYMASMVMLIWLMPDNDPRWPTYYFFTIPVECLGSLTAFFMHVMMLIRLKAFSGTKSKRFIILTSLTGVHLIVGAVSAYLGIQVRLLRADFWLGPQYKIWILLAGMTVLIDAVLNITSAYFFLSHICNALNVSGREMVKEVLIHHDGARWIALVLTNINLIFTLTGVSTNHIATVYHTIPLQYFLAIYCFLESSYFAAKDIMTKHSMGTRALPVTTMGNKSGVLLDARQSMGGSNTERGSTTH
ncbi:hypothetical protein EDD86DRAFT_247170 [Gorgonomyces haynaldii]|nr:hypothetical protein EDD86DRAFT_247170 [Gorgonomyces haynaldii]